MSDSIFIDTNIFVYAYTDDDKTKHFTARNFIRDKFKSKNVIISTQVLSEFYSVMTKMKIPHEIIKNIIYELISAVTVSAVTTRSIEKALSIKGKYAYSWWDSLILASALENGCKRVCSEDMRHGQIIEDALLIENPFLPAAGV